MLISPKKHYTWFSGAFVLKPPSEKGWYAFDCPFCLDHNNYNMAVQMDYEIVKCWKCEYKSYILDFVSIYLNIQYAEAKELIESGEEAAIDMDSSAKILVRKEVSVVPLPTGFKSFVAKSASGILWERAWNYLADRGFNAEVLDAMGFGYCDEHHEDYLQDYFGYIIIPFKKEGRLIYYIGRDFLGGQKKYKNPIESVVGVGKAEILFNPDALNFSEEVYLTEGWACAVTMGKDGVASQGWSLSPMQADDIRKGSFEHLIILPDCGFYKKAIKTAMDFLEHKKVTVVDFEAFGYSAADGLKDVNEIGKSEVLKMIKQTPVLTESRAIDILMA